MKDNVHNKMLGLKYGDNNTVSPGETDLHCDLREVETFRLIYTSSRKLRQVCDKMDVPVLALFLGNFRLHRYSLLLIDFSLYLYKTYRA